MIKPFQSVHLSETLHCIYYSISGVRYDIEYCAKVLRHPIFLHKVYVYLFYDFFIIESVQRHIRFPNITFPKITCIWKTVKEAAYYTRDHFSDKKKKGKKKTPQNNEGSCVFLQKKKKRKQMRQSADTHLQSPHTHTHLVYVLILMMLQINQNQAAVMFSFQLDKAAWSQPHKARQLGAARACTCPPPHVQAHHDPACLGRWKRHNSRFSLYIYKNYIKIYIYI